MSVKYTYTQCSIYYLYIKKKKSPSFTVPFQTVYTALMTLKFFFKTKTINKIVCYMEAFVYTAVYTFLLRKYEINTNYPLYIFSSSKMYLYPDINLLTSISLLFINRTTFCPFIFISNGFISVHVYTILQCCIVSTDFCTPSHLKNNFKNAITLRFHTCTIYILHCITYIVL